MSELTEFLLARIAEDEAEARVATDRVGPGRWVRRETKSSATLRAEFGGVACRGTSVGDVSLSHIARHDPARVLRECEAKRRIVEAHSATCWTSEGMEYELCDECRDERAPCPTIRALAAVYADHNDYRDEWKT